MRSSPAIHPTAVVDPSVQIGDRTVIGPFCVILGPAVIGTDCRIGPHVVIGTTAEHRDLMTVPSVPEAEKTSDVHDGLWFSGLGAGVHVGDRVIIREFSVVNQGTHSPTTIGDDSFIMNSTYIAHDCQIGNSSSIGPVAALAGHVWVGHHATIGMNAAVHQHRRIGALAMIGMNATVVTDISPFCLAKGTPAREASLNRVGLERAGYSPTAIDSIAKYRSSEGTLPELAERDYAEWTGSTR